MRTKAKTRIIAKQLELPLYEEKIDMDSKPKENVVFVKHESKVLNYCHFFKDKIHKESKEKESQAIQELTNSAYELCF